MNLDELATAPATMSENEAAHVISDAYIKEDFILYSSKNTSELDRLIERFMAAHAQLPGITSVPVISSKPAHVLRVQSGDEEGVLEGALYYNGLVLQVRAKGESKGHEFILFVSDVTAKLWNYPRSGISGVERLEGKESE